MGSTSQQAAMIMAPHLKSTSLSRTKHRGMWSQVN
ncbi:uncharacterized protein METZ01_LOCUS81393 [marine metagenome]|uniref:Uncharacterized protein n=1 Tax=marine metagenome TaxID=408172 RepID=A0A381UK59_9ZZZZ